jgi:hypothetical protein
MGERKVSLSGDGKQAELAKKAEQLAVEAPRPDQLPLELTSEEEAAWKARINKLGTGPFMGTLNLHLSAYGETSAPEDKVRLDGIKPSTLPPGLSEPAPSDAAPPVVLAPGEFELKVESEGGTFSAESSGTDVTVGVHWK